MKLYNYQIDAWIKGNGLSHVQYAVVFGADEGDVDYASGILLKKWLLQEDYDVLRLDAKEVKNDIGLLSSEVNNVSLFGQKKVVIISGNTAAKELIDFAQKGNYAGKIIFKMSDLKPHSHFRKIAEQSKIALSIGCYKEDSRQISQYIKNLLDAKKMVYDVQIISCIASILPQNRGVIASEIEKLYIYCNQAAVSVDDVINIMSGQKDIVLDALCVAVLMKDKKSVIKILNENSDENFMLIIRVLQRYAFKVLSVKAKMQDGFDVMKAIESLTPPVFFKQKESLSQVASKVVVKDVCDLINELLLLEKNCKLMNLDHHVMISSMLIQR